MDTGWQIDSKTGYLQGAIRRCSPNYDHRPAGCDIDLIVLHNISLPAGHFGGPYIDALFMNELNPCAHPDFEALDCLRVSSHLLIGRDGRVIQYVPFHLRAWHAGISNYCGRENCNDFSIGIELEGADDTPYEMLQYQRLTQIIRVLLSTYDTLSVERITGHSDIAPGRKTDPGPAFDWIHFKQLLNTA
jgi:Negative regulator of beta-lactamase expression